MATIVPGDAFAEYQRQLKKAERRRDRQLDTLRKSHAKRLAKIEREFNVLRYEAFEKMEAQGRPV